ncbi:DUF397 domain-containing protein [Streptomyces sp. VTCC 41912]|uniref:DUF397 domain-containing protein n=1 Tax=Streptomyces sp. VTCC 41912 TaxID=3383243 RepID=UPI003896B117
MADTLRGPWSPWHGAEFLKSGYSDPDSCVYVARPAGAAPVAVRDDKVAGSAADKPIRVGRPAWAAFLGWLRE